MSFNPLKTVLVFLIISVLWIVVSDQALLMLSSRLDPELLAQIQSGKRIVYILIIGAILFVLLMRQERSIKASARQYKYLFKFNPHPLYIFDMQTLCFVEVNDAALSTYGYRREEFLSKKVQDIVHDDDHLRLEEILEKLPGQYFHAGVWKHRNSSGQETFFSIETNQIMFNGHRCCIVLAQDVTARVKQEEKLSYAYKLEKDLRQELENNLALVSQSLEENRQLAQIIERIDNIVIVTDLKGAVVWVNSAFSEITGYSREEAIGRTTHFLHGPDTDPNTQQNIMDSLSKNGSVRCEILNYTKGGKKYWIDLSISGFYNDHGELERYISIQSVITERKDWEAKIRMQNRTLRLLSWINSHALRKPVASIIGLVNISRESESAEEIKEIQSLIGECSEELDVVIKEIATQVNRIEILDDGTEDA